MCKPPNPFRPTPVYTESPHFNRPPPRKNQKKSIYTDSPINTDPPEKKEFMWVGGGDEATCIHPPPRFVIHSH